MTTASTSAVGHRRRAGRRLLGRLAARLGWGALTLLGTLILVFGLLQLSGDPAKMYAGEKADEATVERIRHELGFDRPLPEQFARYVWRACQGDLGRSTMYNEPVSAMLLRRLPATAALAAAGLAIWVLCGIPVGVYTATHAGRWQDKTWLVIAVVTYSIPTFWLARMLQHTFAYQHRWFPVGAKGLPEYVVVWKHAFRNALLPVVTVLGLDAAKLLGGVVFTEQVFAWPGIGSQAVAAIFNLDHPVVMGTVLLTATLVVAANVAVDLLYLWLDPRLRDA